MGQTVRSLIFSSYQIQDYQLIGGPEWLRTERYDIEAVAEGAPRAAQMLPMVRTLLADRFKLVMHRETRQLPIYKLVTVRGDGQLGPRLKTATCAPPQRGVEPVKGCIGRSAPGSIFAPLWSMQVLANQLGRMPFIGRPVVDETGLMGGYELELSWTPEQPGNAPPPPDAVAIVTALEEQLGLKLQPATGPVDVLVIDSVERPSDNDDITTTSQNGGAASQYEVASIKRNHSGLPNINLGAPPGGRFTVTNAPLREIVLTAYEINDLLIANAPEWTRTEQYDIDARAGGNPDLKTHFAMLRQLLADRFQLHTHREERDIPVYALTRATPTRPQATGLKPAAVDCTAIMAAARNGAPVPKSNRILCGFQYRPGLLSIGGQTMDQIAVSLWPLVSRPVINLTSIAGQFDLDLDFSPDGPHAVPDKPSIFTALQEQLGLRLDPQRAKMEVLVIDRIERPAEN